METKRADTCGFYPLGTPVSLCFLIWCRPETGDRSEIGERQRIFSTVGEHSVLPCRDLFAVSDKLLLHRSATLRRVRHNSAAQLVSLDITSSTCEDKLYRMSKFAGAVCYNVLKICAALLSTRGSSLALRAIHLVPHLRRVNHMCSSTLSVNCGYFTKRT